MSEGYRMLEAARDREQSSKSIQFTLRWKCKADTWRNIANEEIKCNPSKGCLLCSPSIMPNLETLDINSNNEVVNTPLLPTKFLYLKHLSISITSGDSFSPSYDYVSLISFLDASPSLETLMLDVSQEIMEYKSVFGDSSGLRQMPEQPHCCLRSVKMTGFSSAKSLVELTCYIVQNAVSLECLVLDTLYGFRCSGEDSRITRCYAMSKSVIQEATRAVAAIKMYIEDKIPNTVKLTVAEPCTRCHAVGRW